MQKAFNDIIERLEELKNAPKQVSSYNTGFKCSAACAIEIVNQVAEEYKSTEHINCSTDDSISRSVLIDKLQKWKFANEERGYDTAKDLVQEMIDLVKEQLPEAVNGGWIPCEERLPSTTGYYLVTIDGFNRPMYAWWIWTEKKWYYLNSQKEIEDVIAWQPLPKPYVKGE